MNRNKTIGTIIVVILIIFGIYYVVTRNSTTTSMNYPTTNTVPTNTIQQQQQPVGAPAVSTKGTSFVSQSTVVLNGDVNPNGVQTSYWYEYGLSATLGSTSRLQLIGGGNINYQAPAAISGLSPSTQYFYRIVAQNQYGKVLGGISSFQTTTTPPVVFSPPTAKTITATNVNQNSATLNGVTNPNGSTTYFWFEYGKAPLLGNTTSVISTGLGRNDVSVSSQIGGLDPNTTYYYRFNAQNGYGTANGNILSFTTSPANPPPPPVGNPPVSTTESANNVSRTGGTLHGQVNPNGTPTTYYFEYGKSTPFGVFDLGQKTVSKSAGSGTASVAVSTSLSGLDSNSTYYYRLVADNKYGTTRGAIFSFTTSQ